MPLRDATFFDDIWRMDYKVDHGAGKLVRKLTQPDRMLILEHNKVLRNHKGAIKDCSFARFHLRIPMEDYEMLQRKYPVLRNGSNHERNNFYKRFIRNTESIPYRVQ